MKAQIKDKLIIAVSIIIITLLHYFTLSSRWGLHDFYRRLYYIPIILAAFKFKLKGGAISSIIVSILYAPHLLTYFGELNIDIINQHLEIVMFIIIGTITGTLVQSEAKIRHLLEVQIMKLTNLENYTQNILDSILNGVIAVDRDLKVTSINKEGEKILNLKKSLAGEYAYEYFEDPQKVRELFVKVIKHNKQVQNMETNCIGDDGTEIPVRLHIYPLRNILNKSEGIVLVIEDISQIRKLENQVRRAEKLSAIGELASGIAHEIRNPLGIIKTISQTINKEVEDEEIKEGLEIIESEIDRANKVIQGLLDFAKPSVVNYRLQSIDRLLGDVLLLVNKYSQQHKVKIHYTLVEDSMINVDGDKLKQAFINIIFNSIQAMESGGNMYIDLVSSEECTIITFRDTGIGIDKDKLEKIFEPFYTTKEKGTGLGLSITHRIIEEHKGFMEIESDIGIGTTIRIYLPDRKGGDYKGEEDSNS